MKYFKAKVVLFYELDNTLAKYFKQSIKIPDL